MGVKKQAGVQARGAAKESAAGRKQGAVAKERGAEKDRGTAEERGTAKARAGRKRPPGPDGRETPPPEEGAPPGGTEVLLSLSRAREALGLDYDAFDVAVQTGEVRTVACGPRLWLVPPQEVARLRAEEGHPQPLLERVRMVSSGEAAQRLGIGRERFVRLARSGHIRPVRWYVNRYRALVWMYLAHEVPGLAERSPALLHGPLPEGLREAVAQGEDERARSWRARRVAQLVRDAYDPWDEAAVWAALLGPEVVDDALPDPYERAYLRKLRTALPPGRIGPATPELIRAITTADHPDEIALALVSLADALTRARALRAAPQSSPLPVLAGPGPVAAAWPAPEDEFAWPLTGTASAGQAAPSGAGTERWTGGAAPLGRTAPTGAGARLDTVGGAPTDGPAYPAVRLGNWLGGPPAAPVAPSVPAPASASALRPVPTGLGTVGPAVPGGSPRGADPVPDKEPELPPAAEWPAPRRGLLRLLPRAARRGSGRARSSYPRWPGRLGAASAHSSPTSVSRMTARPSSSEAARSTSAEMPQP